MSNDRVGSNLVRQVIDELIERMFKGEEASLAQLISFVEDDESIVPHLVERISARQGNSYRIGITGPPGAGKSVLIEQLTTLFRNDNLSVGILAVDPSSAISGGALLGDRVRMQRHCLDSGVFIRSMATRGNSGGLSKMTSSAMRLLEAFGKDVIIVETTGVGQTEIDVKKIVDSVIAVFTPDSGDTIQLMKTGLLEIADIVVVNKADHRGASWLASEIQDVLSLCRKTENEIPVVTTQATDGTGIKELYQVVTRQSPLKGKGTST